MTNAQPFEVPGYLQRGAPIDKDAHESAVWLIDYMRAQVGLDDLATTDLLDMGCGVKFTRAILRDGIPIGRYVGVDVYKDLIEFLQQNVDDPHFEFHHVDLHNERYNPGGFTLASLDRLPLESEAFDLICLFSVFTHLTPADYHDMLRVLRPHVRPTGRLFFSLYVDEETPGGHGYIDSLVRLLRQRPDLMASGKVEGTAKVPFRDVDPDNPLRIALYSEDHTRALIEGTGWRALKLSQPERFIQHSFVCAPV